MSPVSPATMPIFIIPMVFLFVLLIILINKSPKVGAWLVGGLTLLAPIVLWRCAMPGMSSHPDVVPIFIVPVTFLFVLLIILTAKAPKAGIGLIVALVVMVLYFGTHRLSQPRPVVSQVMPAAPAVPPALPSEPSPPARQAPPAPIWSSGVDQELNADVYPSKLAAARAASTQLGKSIRELAPDANTAPAVVVFQEAHPYQLIAELRDAVRRALPNVSCTIESESRTLRAEELGVTLYLGELNTRSAPWIKQGEPGVVSSGQLDINLSGQCTGKLRLSIRFAEKPWMEDFATFASTRPEQAFIIARSRGTCTSEGEANQQALDDARVRLAQAIGGYEGRKGGPPLVKMPEVAATDVLQGGFIVDRFAQSFEGSAAKIWRQALLLDVSGPKLAQLAGLKAREFRQAKMSWARMALSAVGVVVLIGVIYFFLNMATMGYYEWSLRIACVVLAIVGVLSILMVVR